MTRFEELMKEAKILGNAWNTEWAEDHEDRYDAFAEACESGYDEGQLTAKEFNELGFLREVMHSVDTYNDIADVIKTYPGNVQKATDRLKNLLSLYGREE